MNLEYKVVITKVAETGEKMDATIRIELPYDSPNFKELINIACCYNADVEYLDGMLVVKPYNKELITEICRDYSMYLFGII